MIKERRFVHYNHVFIFKWDSKKHESYIDFKEARALYSFFNEIYLGHIPNTLFNSVTVSKVSQYILKSRSTMELSLLEKKLLAQGLIDVIRGHRILLEVKEAINRLKRVTKDTLLNYLLVKDPEVLAIQIPVWSESKRLVGHIDLILFDKNAGSVIVAEYAKSEKNIKHILAIIKYMDLLQEQVPAISNLSGIIFSSTSLIKLHYSRHDEILDLLE